MRVGLWVYRAIERVGIPACPWRPSSPILQNLIFGTHKSTNPDPISTSLNHAVVAELLHGARRKRGFYGGLYGTRVAALVTRHACLRREGRRTRKTVICAGRALADCPEDEISGHAPPCRQRVASCAFAGEIAPGRPTSPAVSSRRARRRDLRHDPSHG